MDHNECDPLPMNFLPPYMIPPTHFFQVQLNYQDMKSVNL